MKKFIVILGFIGCLSGFISAQTYIADSPGRLFDEGKKFYSDKNYIACIERMSDFKKTATDKGLIRDADYYIVSASFAKNNPNAQDLVQDFLNDYPSSQYENRMNFMMASLYFLEDDYREAIKWFSISDMQLLSTEEEEDYSYRIAYCLLQTGELKQALPFFTKLASESYKYGEEATYYKGFTYYTWEEFDKALSAFTALRKSQEFGLISSFYITQIYYTQKRYEDVIDLGSKILENKSLFGEKQLEVNRVVGESYYRTGDLAQAIPYLEGYVNAAANPLRSSRYILGAAYYTQNDFPDAIKQLSAVSTEDDVITQNVYLLLGQSYLKTGEKNRARMAFESAAEMSFDKQIQEIAMYNCGLLVHETSYSAFGESVLIFERFLNLFPNSVYTDNVNNCLVEMYFTTKNYQAALKSIEQIKKPTPKILEAKQNILFQLGAQSFANNDFGIAKQYFTQSLQVGNYSPETNALNYFWRGETEYRLNNFKGAIADYEAYLSQTAGKDKETYSSALYNLGYAYFKQKNYSSALSNFNKYVSSESNVKKATYSDAYNRIGDCYFSMRNLSQAEASYNKAQSSGGSGDYALFQKGYVMGLQKNYNGKINALNDLINSYPQSDYLPDAYFEKGRAFVMLNQNDKAISTFNELESKFPKSSWSRKAGLQKGMLYFDSRELDNAVAAYKKVIANYPGSEEAQIAVQDLKTVYVEKNDIQAYANYVNSLGGQMKFDVTEQDSLTYLAAEKFYMQGDNTKAKAAMTNYLQSFPNGAFSENARYYLGTIYFSEKNYSEAATAFGKVIAAPDNKFTEDALARCAEIAFIQGDYEKALGYFKSLRVKAEHKENRQAAEIGILRCALWLNELRDVVDAASNLLQDSKLSPELANEALFGRAKALFGLNNPGKAVEDLQKLAEDTRNVYGAEAYYLLAQYYFDGRQFDKSEKAAKDFIQKGSPHGYWLARAFILLADIGIAQNDKFQAKQYLQSLKANYNGFGDDIFDLIEDRMEKVE